MTLATIRSTASHRFSVTIDGTTQDGFALFQFDAKSVRLRRVVGARVEDLNVEPGISVEGDHLVLGASHPEIWAPPSEVEPAASVHDD